MNPFRRSAPSRGLTLEDLALGRLDVLLAKRMETMQLGGAKRYNPDDVGGAGWPSAVPSLANEREDGSLGAGWSWHGGGPANVDLSKRSYLLTHNGGSAYDDFLVHDSSIGMADFDICLALNIPPNNGGLPPHVNLCVLDSEGNGYSAGVQSPSWEYAESELGPVAAWGAPTHYATEGAAYGWMGGHKVYVNMVRVLGTLTYYYADDCSSWHKVFAGGNSTDVAFIAAYHLWGSVDATAPTVIALDWLRLR